MASTSEDRIEVAAKLRQMADGHDVIHAFDSADIRKLAELVDPTCHAELKRVIFDEWYRHDRIIPTCSACGSPLDGGIVLPRYCPGCGARVVDEDD